MTAGQTAGPEPTEVRGLSGRPVRELTLEAVRRAEVSVPDLRIHPDALETQAVVAEQHGNPQLAENGRRSSPRWATTRCWPSSTRSGRAGPPRPS